ncbi:hypothetical protein FGG08_003530 [Glutinoglossum americanum]|uniref:Tryptophan synthase beta chain-like PALP domain-containing protein n=1 Tax=Glutinoglossum americanum TaxID=1670608 RepID=A0A9P8L3G0_9PEZI|nr:hypothetical protein FGG08_003530 [Glutinoglossum americanum]
MYLPYPCIRVSVSAKLALSGIGEAASSLKMVVFVDLEGLESHSVSDMRVPAGSLDWRRRFPLDDKSPVCSQMEDCGAKTEVEEPRELPEIPNRGSFSAALASYPIISQIARDLDLNDLHALALSCRQFRANLLPFRSRLVTQSLRCDIDAERGQVAWEASARKKWRCARDMVAECRKCARVVCRHTLKPGSPTPPSSESLAFTAPAFLRDPCSCPDDPWLCQPCGKPLMSEDVKYHDAWAWRERYSQCLGMMGIGEGVEGVRCGRGATCTAAEITLIESDCDSAMRCFEMGWMITASGEEVPGQGYLIREIEGIGGVVMKKLMRKQSIGAVVIGDVPGEAGGSGQSERREYLGREVRGEQRSCCQRSIVSILTHTMTDPSRALPLTRESVQAAHQLIKPHIHLTPVLTSRTLSALASTPQSPNALKGTPYEGQEPARPRINLFFKCENYQRVGAFKARGAFHAIARLGDDELRRGVITHSSGNHAQALALAAQTRGVEAYVVMPSSSSASKVAATKAYGATVIHSGPTSQEREAVVEEVVSRTGALLVPPYDYGDVILGQGTVGLEFESQVREMVGGEGGLDAIVAPCGGGGLLSGIATALRTPPPPARPEIQIFGAEPSHQGADDCRRGLAANTRIPAVKSLTIADGLRTPVGKIPWSVISDQAKVRGVYAVGEEEIKGAMRLVVERMKVWIEPSAAVAVAVVLFCEEWRRAVEREGGDGGWNVGVVLSGGNITVEDVGKLFAEGQRG